MSGNTASDAPAEARDGACGTEAALSESLPTAAVTDATVRLLKGFADQTRLRILCLLRDREVCVHDIVEALGMTQSAISHQLRVLRDARLVSHRREGRHVYYRLADDHVREMLENALTHGAEPESR
ncbi:ArsR/SmtB family transcription factor [Salinibacter altiplanensis]|uniref:ArsR/SmtB family transcription factor n=1 Tax=Salinibacter altiplanensis TaxID=1803181 RepID=UPI000C9F1546|nr:metalloregulator ArsR/SmtB family transcription factor [Salinibacter altiplanensis]